MVIAGAKTTQDVSLAQMQYHTQAVRRGLDQAQSSYRPLLIADLPAKTYDSEDQALESSRALVRAGADMVKLEGDVIDQVRALRAEGIRVCGHLGLTPQSITEFKVQARTPVEQDKLLSDAVDLEKAGVEILVLEMLPAPFAKKVTQSLHIPTIGIGAGVETTGQVLVLYDLLGLNPDFSPRFLKKFAQGSDWVQEALRLYSTEVRARKYPAKEHSFGLS
jgi:3-methyl-2-oxobutanoate hydroxymethyltransferase